MALKEGNTRAIITLPKEMKEQLEQIAKDENRSLSGQIVFIVKKYLESR